MAQDRQDEADLSRRKHQRLQEDSGALHQLRPPKEAGENKLGDASVPLRRKRGGERRRARSL